MLVILNYFFMGGIMNKVIEFANKSYQYKFVQNTIWVKFRSGNESILKQMAVISLKNQELDVEIIHPLSDFIFSLWKNYDYNTQRKHCSRIVSFMNFLINNSRRFNISSLFDIGIVHGNCFLNNKVSEGCSRETIKDIERTLTHFYMYLLNNQVLEKVTLKQFNKKHKLNGEIYYESIFSIIYPSKRPQNIEHALPPEYIPLFIEIAISVASPIALGVYLQFFGGLRAGEVVNLKRTDLKAEISGQSYLACIRQSNLRTNIKESSGANSTKKPRYQEILMIKDWFDLLYQQHLSKYRASDNSNALFVNTNGEAMSGRSYRQYFEKVKKHFIEVLRNSNNEQAVIIANHLRFVKWSTHIGRGTFTNLLAEEADNPLSLAFLRGDKNINSSLYYISKTERQRNKYISKIEIMHKDYIPSLLRKE